MCLFGVTSDMELSRGCLSNSLRKPFTGKSRIAFGLQITLKQAVLTDRGGQVYIKREQLKLHLKCDIKHVGYQLVTAQARGTSKSECSSLC